MHSYKLRRQRHNELELGAILRPLGNPGSLESLHVCDFEKHGCAYFRCVWKHSTVFIFWIPQIPYPIPHDAGAVGSGGRVFGVCVQHMLTSTSFRSKISELFTSMWECPFNCGTLPYWGGNSFWYSGICPRTWDISMDISMTSHRKSTILYYITLYAKTTVYFHTD